MQSDQLDQTVQSQSVDGLSASAQLIHAENQKMIEQIAQREKNIAELKKELEQLKLLKQSLKITNYIVVRKDGELVGVSARRSGQLLKGSLMLNVALGFILCLLIVKNDRHGYSFM